MNLYAQLCKQENLLRILHKSQNEKFNYERKVPVKFWLVSNASSRKLMKKQAKKPTVYIIV